MTLVTGGTGMLGAHLLYKLCQKDIKIRATRRASSKLEQVRKIFAYYTDDIEPLWQKIEWVYADMTDYESVLQAADGIKTIYHTAAQVSFDPKKRQQLINNNTAGAKHIVNAALECGVKKVCHVSSIAALGNTPNGELITEETAKNNLESSSGYAVSKFTSETEIWRGIEEGLNAVIVNPSIILGAGDWKQGSPAFISSIAEGLKYYTSGINGFVDVRDVADAVIQLTESDISGEAFILNSENLSFKTVFSLIAKYLNKKAPHKAASTTLLKTARILEAVRSKLTHTEPRITKETIEAAFDTQNYSAEKIKQRLDFSFRPVEQSVSDFCRFYKQDTAK